MYGEQYGEYAYWCLGVKVELNTNLHRLQSCKLLTVIEVNFIILTWEN